jgi:hypothetical protein
MMPFSPNGECPDGSRQVLWEDDERAFCRGWRPGMMATRAPCWSFCLPRGARRPSSLDHLAHEHGLKDELNGAWAVQPLELVRDGGHTLLVLEDPGGEPLDRLLGGPMEVGPFLRLAIGIASAVGKLQQRGLMHKDINPGRSNTSRSRGQTDSPPTDSKSRWPGTDIGGRQPDKGSDRSHYLDVHRLRELSRQMLDEGTDRWEQALPVRQERRQRRFARDPPAG